MSDWRGFDDADHSYDDRVMVSVGMLGFDCVRCKGINTATWRYIHYECDCGMSYNGIYEVVPYGDDGFVTKDERLAVLDEKFDIIWNQVPAAPSSNLLMNPPSGTTCNGVLNE
jgi:hypothetical protein